MAPREQYNPLDFTPQKLTSRQVLILVGVLLVVIVGLALAYVYTAGSALFRAADMETHTYAPPMFATAPAATKACGVKVPPEATNVWVETRSEWLEYGEYVRFEAPVSVCLTHAADVVKGKPLLPVYGNQTAENDGAPIRALPGPPGANFTGARPRPGWFDLPSATNVVGAGGDSNDREQPQVWVDQSRGVYYYHVGSI